MVGTKVLKELMSKFTKSNVPYHFILLLLCYYYFFFLLRIGKRTPLLEFHGEEAAWTWS